MVRGRAIAGYSWQARGIYASSLLISAAFWMLPLWIVARLAGARASRSGWSVRVAIVLALWVLPFATFAFAGQVIYYRVFHSYMGRDTLRLGVALRGTVTDWIGSWGGAWLVLAMVGAGIGVTLGALAVARRASITTGRFPPLLLVGTFVGALACGWFDAVDSRFLQAATPDACFVHSVMHAARATLTGQSALHQGMSLRNPSPLPPLTSSRARPPNVVVVLLESVRADALCSEGPPRCTAKFLDEVAADRVPLGTLTTPAPNTFSAFVILSTGLPTSTDFTTAHTAPVLWELARAVGYRTAYLSSQNPQYEDFGAFVRNAGIDVLATGADLGGMEQEQLGAPDERAYDAALRFVRGVPADKPYFAVVHLSNTHAPYRNDPELAPYAPHSPDPIGDVEAFHNQYRNSVLLEERMLAGFLRELRASRQWDDTAVVVLSDHGETFREHGGLYHNHSLFEEEVRVPGFIVAGARVLDDEARGALRSWSGRRTFTHDVHATVVDLLGLDAARGSLPVAERVAGESLLRGPRGNRGPALMATSTGVWEPDDARFGAMGADRLVVGAPGGHWVCFDLARDPLERAPRPGAECGELVDAARRGFPMSGIDP